MTIELALGALVALAFGAAGAGLAIRGELDWAMACAAACFIGLVSRYYAFNLTVLRSTKKFPTLARARFFGAVFEFAVFSAGALLLGFPGMLAAALAAQLAGAVFVRFDGGLRYAPCWDASLALKLLQAGWPLAAEALALALLRSVDRFVILQCLDNGTEQLGWYRIAIVMGAWVFDQSTVVSNVIFPQLGATLGRTRDPIAVTKLALRAAEHLALGLLAGSAAIMALGIPVIQLLLPNYRPGLAAAGGMVAAAALLGINMPLRYALLTIGRTRAMLAATAASTLLSLAASVCVLRWGARLLSSPLAGVAWASAGSAFVLFLVTLALCASSRPLWPGACRVACVSLLVVVGVTILQGLDGHATLTLAAALGFCAVPTWLLARRVELPEWMRRRAGEDRAANAAGT
jgi:hypothetical protein